MFYSPPLSEPAGDAGDPDLDLCPGLPEPDLWDLAGLADLDRPLPDPAGLPDLDLGDPAGLPDFDLLPDLDLDFLEPGDPDLQYKENYACLVCYESLHQTSWLKAY